MGNKKISREDIIEYIKLGLGHTNITHKHLLNRPKTHKCRCNINTITLKHISMECDIYKTNTQSDTVTLELLKKTNTQNIINTIKNLYKLIKKKKTN